MPWQIYSQLISKSDTGNLVYHLHPGQRQVWLSKARFTFMIAGTQGGKTILGAPWLYKQIMIRGQGDYLAVTSSYDLFRVKMLPAMVEFFCNITGVGKYWGGINAIELKHPRLGFLAKTQHDPMWGRIILRSAASKAGLESATANAAWLDECGQAEFGFDAWEAVLRRVSLRQGAILGTTTPYNMGWLKREVHDRWLAGDPDYNVVQFASVINPAFPSSEYERAERTMAAWRFKMFYKGEFTKPAGLIYAEFDENKMTYDPAARGKKPKMARWAVGLDFGGANTCKLYAWLDEATNRWHVHQEQLSGGQATQDHAATLKQATKGVQVLSCHGGAFGETQYRMDWEKAGVTVLRPTTDDVEIGISSVITAFKSGKLLISKECHGLLSELGSYSRELDNLGAPTNIIDNKAAYHRLDALRYLVVSVITDETTVTAQPNPFYGD